jgi:anti-sigma regulatory factor (Ser/Thr protein kinase)
MSHAFSFRKKILSRLKISIDTKARFQEIYTVFNEIVFPFNHTDREHYTYAILELVNNSLRAHRERDTSRPVQVSFRINNGNVEIEVLDSGGGFDPSRLPWDLNADVRTVDLHGKAFEDYRRTHGNSRFGMGLYIAKRLFTDFSIGFIDEKGTLLDWGAPGIAGTRIFLLLSGGAS